MKELSDWRSTRILAFRSTAGLLLGVVLVLVDLPLNSSPAAGLAVRSMATTCDHQLPGAGEP
jgi:hypothetical protein